MGGNSSVIEVCDREVAGEGRRRESSPVRSRPCSLGQRGTPAVNLENL